jgi:hypothetical protein
MREVMFCPLSLDSVYGGIIEKTGTTCLAFEMAEVFHHRAIFNFAVLNRLNHLLKTTFWARQYLRNRCFF